MFEKHLSENPNFGEQIYEFADTLFPICRSLTGEGVRQTLDLIKDLVPRLEILSEPSGKRVFDWEIPEEWNIREAYIVSPSGERVIDFKENNLHVVGYSVPVDFEIDLCDLQEHLHSLPDKPDSIPYVTSYYEKRWGFCLTDRKRKELLPGRYRVVIDSTLEPGVMNYGEALIPGKYRDSEVLFSTYVCHPSLANNEISGPAVLSYIAKFLLEREKDLNLTYRIVFCPETIGSISYISKNLENLRNRVVAGFNLTCIGDDRAYSYLPSRNGHTLADRVMCHVLQHTDPNYLRYSYLDRGSDERQYCAPGVDLPLCSFMRSKYGEYPEYHTSKDDMDLISAKGLHESFSVIGKCIDVLENNTVVKPLVICEPQLGKRGLYGTLGGQSENYEGKKITDFLAYADGENDILTIAEHTRLPFSELRKITDLLVSHRLVTLVDDER